MATWDWEVGFSSLSTWRKSGMGVLLLLGAERLGVYLTAGVMTGLARIIGSLFGYLNLLAFLSSGRR
jgi:hypothetical protein